VGRFLRNDHCVQSVHNRTALEHLTGGEILDVRNLFKNLSLRMAADFEGSPQVAHAGGKGSVREDTLADFLRTYFPTLYGVGRGEIVTPDNRHSGQLDIIIYDATRCPVLLPSDSHAIYPIESVFGVISVKSRLNSTELSDAYKNIASLKSIVPMTGFTHSTGAGFAAGLGAPIPVTGVFSYAADRTIEAIAKQAQELDSETAEALRPDFIAVLGEGILASRSCTRGEFNNYKPPADPKTLRAIRKTGRLTLLRMYMELLRDLNLVHLRPFDLAAYDNMPKLIGNYRVRRHDHFVLVNHINGTEDGPFRLTETALERIVGESTPVSLQQHRKNTLGNVEVSGKDAIDPPLVIYEFNPNSLPPMNFSSLQKNGNGRPFLSEPGFHPVGIEIDGKNYAVDLSAFVDLTAISQQYLERNFDLTIDEIFSL